MNQELRAKKDILKLEKILREFKELGLGEKHPKITEWAGNYLSDAKHFFEKGDYFSAFGAANYSYGIIDGILISEGKKNGKNTF